MVSFIRKILEGKNGEGPESERDRQQKKHVAAGVLLLEAAHSDNQCSDDEAAHIVKTLKDKFGLPDNCVAELLELARRGQAQAVDLWQFTNLINQQFSPAAKIAIMEDVWRIILLDGQLDKHEDHYAHKLANLLRLSQKQLITAKLAARGQISASYGLAIPAGGGTS